MSTITVRLSDHEATIELNRPKAHAMNLEMIRELTEAFIELAELDNVHGVILTAQGSIFSAGLDVVELFGLDEDRLDGFWEAFHSLMKCMVSFPKPLIAAVNGHAIAGGCVMALCCDHRVMAEGRATIGLNEVPVGLVVPQTVIDLAGHVVGPGTASRMFLNGTLYGSHEAKDIGLIDEYCPEGETLLWAQTKLRKWLAMHPDAWLKTKALLRKPLIEALDVSINEGYGETIREWWSADGRAAVRKTVEQLTKKKGA